MIVGKGLTIVALGICLGFSPLSAETVLDSTLLHNTKMLLLINNDVVGNTMEPKF